jgi:hypothetical protein
MVDRYYSAKKLVAERVYEILDASAVAMDKFGLEVHHISLGLPDEITRQRTVTSVRFSIREGNWGGLSRLRDALRAKDPDLAFLMDIPFYIKRNGPVYVRNLISMEPS